MTSYDWRGHKYEDATPLFRYTKTVELDDGWFTQVQLDKPEPVTCEFDGGCTKQAVTNPCAAEGGFRRTHHHGEVHTKSGAIKALCAEHGDIENARWDDVA